MDIKKKYGEDGRVELVTDKQLHTNTINVVNELLRQHGVTFRVRTFPQNSYFRYPKGGNGDVVRLAYSSIFGKGADSALPNKLPYKKEV
jgi:hypothetical protein